MQAHRSHETVAGRIESQTVRPERTRGDATALTAQAGSPRLGLALSGGGARGLAHIGVLKVLEREGLQVGAISGASMGGVIGALYAAGFGAEELEALARQLCRPRALLKLVDLGFPRRGLVSSENLRQLLGQFIPPSLTFAELKIPLALTATDLRAGRQARLLEGSVLDAAMATSAFPGVFPPVRIAGRILVDGGALNNLPVDLLTLLGQGPAVAVDVAPYSYPEDSLEESDVLPEMAQIVYRTSLLMSHALTEANLAKSPPDLIVRPRIPTGIGVFDGFTRVQEIIAAGEQAADERSDEVRRACARWMDEYGSGLDSESQIQRVCPAAAPTLTT